MDPHVVYKYDCDFCTQKLPLIRGCTDSSCFLFTTSLCYGCADTQLMRMDETFCDTCVSKMAVVAAERVSRRINESRKRKIEEEALVISDIPDPKKAKESFSTVIFVRGRFVYEDKFYYIPEDDITPKDRKIFDMAAGKYLDDDEGDHAVLQALWLLDPKGSHAIKKERFINSFAKEYSEKKFTDIVTVGIDRDGISFKAANRYAEKKFPVDDEGKFAHCYQRGKMEAWKPKTRRGGIFGFTMFYLSSDPIEEIGKEETTK